MILKYVINQKYKKLSIFSNPFKKYKTISVLFLLIFFVNLRIPVRNDSGRTDLPGTDIRCARLRNIRIFNDN